MTIEIMTSCPFCGEPNVITISQEEYENYYIKGMLIQDAMPDLTATEREMLISGICPSCQKGLFGE